MWHRDVDVDVDVPGSLLRKEDAAFCAFWRWHAGVNLYYKLLLSKNTFT